MKKSLLLVCIIIVSCQFRNTELASDGFTLIQLFDNTEKLKIDSTLILQTNNSTLLDFYRKNDFNTVWQSEIIRKNILSELHNCHLEGLDPMDYRLDVLQQFEEKHLFLNDAEMVNYDIQLTNSLQDYLTHVSIGKLNPKKIYSDWDLKPKEFDVNEIINTALKENFENKPFESVKPTNKNYVDLKKALQIIDQLPNDYTTPLSFKMKEKIKPNDKHTKINWIKKRLMYWDYLSKNDSINNVFDKETVAAIQLFQKNNGLISDGIIGKSTVTALNFNKSERREQIIANLERWRWFPNEWSAHYALVNIPNYHLNVYKDNELVQNYKIIVGTDKRKSPVLTSKLASVVFNPTWTVPPTIIKEDLIPEMNKSKSYLNKMKIIAYDYKKRRINPWLWKEEDAFKYTYVQDPGIHNSLGLMKILFKNKYAVYLHDTNHKDGFSKNIRSFSSGCTRVENPLLLAKYVLNDTVNYNNIKIDSIIQLKKTKIIPIKASINYYQLYYTAWLEGKHLAFREDIYNLDAELYCKLRNKSY
ncbi:hypothetical protein B0A58_05740 [Flavobacterium branchiophilum NBRC 15030 = ATCC 35035]|uniref:Murein L,D-transpeptidase YcbB/YkuD n=1 Tax=Flavobacterium branchiophilum TaxID=55197 RepID=A0A543G1R0_9FLAO|nr:L,D-transpeptidase family protein [Flavobacterium branchiophilum]OXA77382.1 hypothetical protein B0A58_05740 [Flavobacterium branchiophilum NBRC 15030 = ATCC 35035]TQM40022.1 murein L,D-transpeptidase YcbB/YkuD [Flavobacterium branchiophilum]